MSINVPDRAISHHDQLTYAYIVHTPQEHYFTYYWNITHDSLIAPVYLILCYNILQYIYDIWLRKSAILTTN
jgi:hypothetical protein